MVLMKLAIFAAALPATLPPFSVTPMPTMRAIQIPLPPTEHSLSQAAVQALIDGAVKPKLNLELIVAAAVGVPIVELRALAERLSGSDIASTGRTL